MPTNNRAGDRHQDKIEYTKAFLVDRLWHRRFNQLLGRCDGDRDRWRRPRDQAVLDDGRAADDHVVHVEVESVSSPHFVEQMIEVGAVKLA